MVGDQALGVVDALDSLSLFLSLYLARSLLVLIDGVAVGAGRAVGWDSAGAAPPWARRQLTTNQWSNGLATCRPATLTAI